MPNSAPICGTPLNGAPASGFDTLIGEPSARASAWAAVPVGLGRAGLAERPPQTEPEASGEPAVVSLAVGLRCEDQ